MDTLDVIGAGGKPTAAQGVIRVLGIDLGTTNSTVAEIICDPATDRSPAARCLEIDQETEMGTYTHLLVPSVVVRRGGTVLVGEGAKRMRTHPELKRNRDIFYECKNDIGNRRTYHLAGEAFQGAAEIGGHVLSFLRQSALATNPLAPARMVVTVPASFQLAQRMDTLKAARLAEIEIGGGDLLDEPVAGFLDYLITHREELLPALQEPKTIIVFDFGGGTCDVAVFRFVRRKDDGRLEISPLAVSRYYRLGGGDIDAAIVHEVLIPELIRQNQLPEKELNYEDRKVALEPALLGIAESLKIGLCIEISKLLCFGKYRQGGKDEVVKTHPGVFQCACGVRTFQLKSPRLTAAQFERLLTPFLDMEFLHARETEYRLTCSVFAPLKDALDRSGLAARDIHFCLLIGGSSLIPQVQKAVAAFFPASKLLMYEDRDSTQVAVARGASYHALSLALFNRSLVQPVAHEPISIRTANGLIALIPQGESLPLPTDGSWAENLSLVVPQAAQNGGFPLRVEIVAGQEARPLFVSAWQIEAPVTRGEPLRLKYRCDENQTLRLELELLVRTDREPFKLKIENPLTNVVNPHAARLRIEEAEENLRSGKVPPDEVSSRLLAIARDYAELKQLDKAIFYLQEALRRPGGSPAQILLLLGIYYGEKQDYERQEMACRESFKAHPEAGAPLFNLALSKERRGLFKEAEEVISQAIQAESDPPYLVLKARLLSKLGKETAGRDLVAEAMSRFGPPTFLNDWELGWYQLGARLSQDQKKVAQAAELQRQRSRRQVPDEADGGFLPEIAPKLRKL